MVTVAVEVVRGVQVELDGVKIGIVGREGRGRERVGERKRGRENRGEIVISVSSSSRDKRRKQILMILSICR